MKFYEIVPSLKHLKHLKESTALKLPAPSKHKKASPDEASSSFDHEIVPKEGSLNEAILAAEELYTSVHDLPLFRAAYASFTQQYPKFSETLLADDIREEEYSHLQENDRICMDFRGLGLVSFMQRWQNERSCSFRLSYISACMYDHALYGAAAEGTMEFDLRQRIFAFLNVREEEYFMIFTASHASAFKLLGETFSFSSCPRLLSVYDHENESLNWMIQGAKVKSAKIMTASFRWPSMRICSTNLRKLMQDKKRKREKKRGMFVFPTQSEVTGTKYSYQWMTLAEKHKWQVVLDASALGPKDMASLGLSLYRPDFMVFPFYSIFGFDRTGFACLFIKKSSLQYIEKSSSRSLGMVRIVPLLAESFTDSEEEFEQGKAEKLVHLSGHSQSEEDNGDAPLESSCRVDHNQEDINAEQLRQKHFSISETMRREVESSFSGADHVALKDSSKSVGQDGCGGHHLSQYQESEATIANFVHDRSVDSPPVKTKNNASVEVLQEGDSGGDAQVDLWSKQPESIACSLQMPSASFLDNSSSHSMLNTCHNSSPHDLFNSDQYIYHEEEKSNVRRKHSATPSFVEFESMQTHEMQVNHHGSLSFSFRREDLGLRSDHHVSPKVSETSLSNLAYESEPETRSSGVSDNFELEEIDPSFQISTPTKSPRGSTNGEILPEEADEVEDSYHKRLGRDDGLIDSRKVDYFPSPSTEEGEDDLPLSTNSGLFVYRKKGISGYLEPLPDDMYFSNGEGSEASEDEYADVKPQLTCRGLDHADSLGLTRINTRLRCLVNWLVESFAKLHHARQGSPHPLVQIIGPKVKFDRGAFVAFNLVDSMGTLLDPHFVQTLAKKSNIHLQLAHMSNSYKEPTSSAMRIQHFNQGASNPFVAKSVTAPKLPVLTAALNFLSSFEDVYRLWTFVSRFLDDQFVSQGKLEYDPNQEEVP